MDGGRVGRSLVEGAEWGVTPPDPQTPSRARIGAIITIIIIIIVVVVVIIIVVSP